MRETVSKILNNHPTKEIKKKARIVRKKANERNSKKIFLKTKKATIMVQINLSKSK
jgi:hypothetical protein